MDDLAVAVPVDLLGRAGLGRASGGALRLTEVADPALGRVEDLARLGDRLRLARIGLGLGLGLGLGFGLGLGIGLESGLGLGIGSVDCAWHARSCASIRSSAKERPHRLQRTWAGLG